MFLQIDWNESITMKQIFNYLKIIKLIYLRSKKYTIDHNLHIYNTNDNSISHQRGKQ